MDERNIGLAETGIVHKESEKTEGSLQVILWDERDIEGLKERYGQSRIVRITRFESTYHARSSEEINQEPYMVSTMGIPTLGEIGDPNQFLCEVMIAPEGETVQYGAEYREHLGLVEMSRVGEQAMVRLAVPEALYDHTPENACYAAYKELFQLGEEYGLGNLVRCWNYVPDILGRPEQEELTDDMDPYEKMVAVNNPRERYKLFNNGRFDAFRDYGPKDEKGKPKAPAATGIASHGGPLVVEAWFMQSPVTYVKNKRQTDPVFYNLATYGRKPPLFSRGSYFETETTREFVVSGTASLLQDNVIYHPSAPVMADTNLVTMDRLYQETLEGQVNLTLDNIKFLLCAENLADQGVETEFTLSDLTGIRVYIKHPTDYARIKEMIEAQLPGIKAVYVQDDICRDGWLLEIEGIAVKPK